MLDRYLGAEFRDGLGKLKDKVESERRPVPPPPPPTATLGVPEQPGVVPGAPMPDGTTAPVPGAPAADAGAAQPEQRLQRPIRPRVKRQRHHHRRHSPRRAAQDACQAAKAPVMTGG